MTREPVSAIIVDDERVAREILENYLGQFEEIHLACSCRNAHEAFEAINRQKVDLVFLDISMPGISGVSFAHTITNDIKVIFTTAHREYALEGFELAAVDYLLKPISFERFEKAVHRFLELRKYSDGTPVPDYDRHLHNGSIQVRSERKMIRIRHADILYIESYGDYLKIHTSDQTIVTRETLSELASELPAESFMRTHRSFIVALDRITSYTGEYLEIGRHQIPISRSMKTEVMGRLSRT